MRASSSAWRRSPRRSSGVRARSSFGRETRDPPFTGGGGRVAIEIAVPGRGRVIILTVGPGEVFGWSSLFHQRPKTASARTIEPTRALALDAGPAARAVRCRPPARLCPDATDPRGRLRAPEGHPDAATGYLRPLSRATCGRALRSAPEETEELGDAGIDRSCPGWAARSSSTSPTWGD